MDDSIRLLLLKIVDDNGNISNLEKAGYQYSEIAHEYSKLINEELIIANSSLQFELSDKGKDELQYIKADKDMRGRWKIEAYGKFRIDKMGKYDIFIE